MITRYSKLSIGYVIFVQVCRTKDNIFVSRLKYRFWSIKKRGSEDKCFWSDDVIRSTSSERNLKHLKKRGSEDKCSLSDDVIRSTSSKADLIRSAPHQKHISPEA